MNKVNQKHCRGNKVSKKQRLCYRKLPKSGSIKMTSWAVSSSVEPKWNDGEKKA